MTSMFERTKLLIGQEGFDRLQQSRVLVIGVGGVGSLAAESLARSGVGELVLVDGDDIDITNLNRQIQTHHGNVGKSKVEEMKHHLLWINPELKIETHHMFFDKDSDHIFEGVDYVIDAIDTISSKMDLVELCFEKKIPFVSSTGMGNRLDPSKLEYLTLDKTSYDPVARIMRNIARDRHLDMRKIPVVWSSEKPISQTKVIHEDGETRKQKQPPASMLLVPPAAGLLCASVCIRDLTE